MDVDGDGTTDVSIAPGEGISPQELLPILRGIIKTLGLPDKKKAALIKAVDKLEKSLGKEFKNEHKKKVRLEKAFEDLIRKIRRVKAVFYSSVSKLRKELRSRASPQKAKLLAGFFKTGKGEYGEGDVFLGVTVPETRKIAIKYCDLSLADIAKLIRSEIHEERLLALLILVHKFEEGDDSCRNKIFNFYLKNTKYINNWDLADLTAPKIVGAYLVNRPRGILYKLAGSKSLWERRIAILATYAFIKAGDFKDALIISEILLNDAHDLIHKAVGWMLREVGKRSQTAEKQFLKKYYKTMSRTMLRYAIERFPERLRKAYSA